MVRLQVAVIVLVAVIMITSAVPTGKERAAVVQKLGKAMLREAAREKAIQEMEALRMSIIYIFIILLTYLICPCRC